MREPGTVQRRGGSLDEDPPARLLLPGGLALFRTNWRTRTGKEAFSVGLGDRKSTRLNSSHLGISYAVFCLKKKKKFRESLWGWVFRHYWSSFASRDTSL